MTASAVLRVGDRAPELLQGIPVVSPDYKPGEVTIVIGRTRDEQPVTITITSLEWTEDLEDAARVAFAVGVVRVGMNLTAVVR
jgi:hypothetical protein